MGATLHGIRSVVNPLVEAPNSLFSEDMSVVVVLHGTEIVPVARKNESRHEATVAAQRWRSVRLSRMTGSRPTSTSVSAGNAASPRRSSRASW